MSVRHLLLIGFVFALAAAPEAMWAPNERTIALDRAESALNDYNYPERVPAIKAYVEARRGALLAIADQKTFAKTLTSYLQTASRDKHFVVWYSEDADSKVSGPPTAAERAAYAAFYRYVGEGYGASARLRGNVGYLKLGGFADLSGARSTIDSVMHLMSTTAALIIDMRGNAGGDSDTVDYLTGYFFARPIQLARISTRKNARIVESKEFSTRIPSSSSYLDKPVYILVDHKTISGGEMFTYTMKNAHRATVIGVPTVGAANGLSSAPVYLTDHLRLSVPDTRIVSPVTNTNWEGGVQPDVRMAPERSLLYAYEQALHNVPKASDMTGELNAALAHPAQALHDSLPIR